jgi:hypothetical protein
MDGFKLGGKLHRYAHCKPRKFRDDYSKINLRCACGKIEYSKICLERRDTAALSTVNQRIQTALEE